MKQLRNKKGKFILTKPKLLIKKRSEKLAEFIGIMLGDGNIYKSGNSHMIRITCDGLTDNDYIFKHIIPLIYNLFKIKAGFYQAKNSRAIVLTISNKNLVYTLEYFGLQPNNKLKNNVSIPEWIFKSKNYIKACIRGLIDTDGTVLPITGRNYTYIWFTSNIPNLRNSFEKAMNILDYKISKWNHRKSRGSETYIGAKNLIRKYYKEIGFSNLKHERRFMLPR
tara:strand:+ start:1181 stop:1849 length:669 start_codon:yes stop_codon:yes gene_type:complete